MTSTGRRLPLAVTDPGGRRLVSARSLAEVHLHGAFRYRLNDPKVAREAWVVQKLLDFRKHFDENFKSIREFIKAANAKIE
jgi:hypothetical protein